MKKSLPGLGLIALIITMVMVKPSAVNSTELKKYGRCHNGVSLCLPKPAYDAHMREHELTKKSFDCIPIENCESNQESKGRSATGCRPAGD